METCACLHVLPLQHVSINTMKYKNDTKEAKIKNKYVPFFQ